MRSPFLLILLVGLFPVCSAAQGTTYPPLAVGTQAPDFSLPFATRDSIGSGELTLSAFRDQRIVVLLFFPAAWSGGCTKEVCTFRDNYSALDSLDAVILAVSGDYTYSQHEWAKYHNLPFTLLSDHRHRVSAVYHSYNETSGYNKRSAFVVDKQGNIGYIDLTYSTRDLASFEKLRDAVNLVKASEQQ